MAVSPRILTLLTIILLAVNYSYHRAEARPPTYDDAWYLENSLHFYHHLTENGWREFWESYKAALGIKAPLISVLPLPFYRLFGASYSSALLVNAVFVVLTNIYLFLLARRLFSPEVGLLAVLFYQTMPLAYGLSRTFMTDYGLTALVVAGLYYLDASDGLARWRTSFLLGVTIGLGLLMKVVFPAFLAGPFLLTLARRGLRPLWPLVTVAVPAVAITSTWYASHLGDILEYAWNAAYGPLGAAYGAGGFSGWALALVNHALSPYYTAAMLLCGGAVVFRARERQKWDPALVFVLAWLVPALVALGFGRNREIRLTAPLLPAGAIMLAFLISELGRGPKRTLTLGALTALAPVCLYLNLSFSRVSLPEIRLGPLVLLSRDLGWAHAPDSQGDWGQPRLLTALQQLQLGERGAPQVMLGVDHLYFNANLITYLNATTRYPMRLHPLAEPGVTPLAAVRRIYGWDPLFLVLGEGFPPESLSPATAEVRSRINRGELPYRLMERLILTDGMAITIYRRDEAWQSVSSPPSQTLGATLSGGFRLLGYDWKPAIGRLWSLSLHWRTPEPLQQDYRVQVEVRRPGDILARRDQLFGGGQYSPSDRPKGESVVQIVPVYVPPGSSLGPLQAAVRLLPSASGDRAPPITFDLAE
jgi:hypothetical protein